MSGLYFGRFGATFRSGYILESGLHLGRGTFLGLHLGREYIFEAAFWLN